MSTDAAFKEDSHRLSFHGPSILSAFSSSSYSLPLVVDVFAFVVVVVFLSMGFFGCVVHCPWVCSSTVDGFLFVCLFVCLLFWLFLFTALGIILVLSTDLNKWRGGGGGGGWHCPWLLLTVYLLFKCRFVAL